MVLSLHALADSTSFYWYQNERFGKYNIFTWNALTKKKHKTKQTTENYDVFFNSILGPGELWCLLSQKKMKIKYKSTIFCLPSIENWLQYFFFRLRGDPWRTHPSKNAKSAIKKIDTDVINIKSFSQYLSDLNVPRILTQPFSRIRVHIILFVRQF